MSEEAITPGAEREKPPVEDEGDYIVALAKQMRVLGAKKFRYEPGCAFEVEFSDDAIRLGLREEMQAVSRAGQQEAGQLQRDAKIDEAEREQRELEEELASA